MTSIGIKSAEVVADVLDKYADELREFGRKVVAALAAEESR